MLGVLALAIVVVTGWRWMKLIGDVAIPRNRAPYLAAFLGGGLLGVAAIVNGGLLATLTGGLAAVVGIGFTSLRLLSGQRSNRPAVAVGDPMLAFSAPDANGADFEITRLHGKPYLLKFFRGHW